MEIKLKVWRQKNKNVKGKLETYDVPGISEDMSFLEMLDVLNERLEMKGEDPIAFRRAHLARVPRLQAALDLVRARSDWDTPVPARCGRGVAAQIAEFARMPRKVARDFAQRVNGFLHG